MGRPSSLTAVCGKDDKGADVTVFERIIEDVRVGCYIEDAAAHAGVHKDTVYEWERVGARAYQALDRARRLAKPAPALSNHEQRCMLFSDAVAQARAEWVVHANALLERLMRGGLHVDTVTTEVVDGKTVRTTTKRETLAPDVRVLLWRLERTRPDGYGRRVAIEHSGEIDTGRRESRDETAERLEHDLRQFLTAQDQAKQNGSA